MLNDISYLDKDERIKTLIFDLINKNQSSLVSSRQSKPINSVLLSDFFDKTWDKFSHITPLPSFEYKTKDGLSKSTSTATIKTNDIVSLINIINSEEYKFNSFIIYNLSIQPDDYLQKDEILFRFAVLDDLPAIVRETRNKKIDNILNGK